MVVVSARSALRVLKFLPALGLLLALATPLAAECPQIVWNPAASGEGPVELSLGGRWRAMIHPGPRPIEARYSLPDQELANWPLLRIDQSFGELRRGQPVPDNGLTAFFRCEIELRGAAPEGLALDLGVILEADAVYFNGVPVGETGSLQPPRVDIEGSRLYSLPAPLWREGKNAIVVRVFSEMERGGVLETPHIVSEQRRASELIAEEIPNIVLASSYILVAAFFALFFVFFRHQRENLFFALFSLGLGVYNLIRTRLRYEMFDDFALSYVVELTLLFTLPVLFLEYLTFTTGARRSLLQKILYGAYALLILATALLPARPENWDIVIRTNLVLVPIVLGMVFFTLWRHYQHNRERLRFLLIGFVILAPFVLADVLSTWRLHSGPRVVVFGFALFLFFASLQLSNTILSLYRNIHEQELELRQLEKKKTRSIYNISNEFNYILSGLQQGLAGFLGHAAGGGKAGATSAGGNAGAARKKSRARGSGPDPEQQIRASVLNLDNLATDSRLLQALENEEYSPRFMRFAPRKLGLDVIERALASTVQPRNRVAFELPDAELQISSDPELVFHAVYHILENALLYSTGAVELHMGVREGLLECIVRDEGPGMPPELQRQVFQRFVRASDATEEGAANPAPPGSGVGLTLVDLVCEVLDGDVRIEGGGFFSAFVLTIPLPDAEEAA